MSENTTPRTLNLPESTDLTDFLAFLENTREADRRAMRDLELSNMQLTEKVTDLIELMDVIAFNSCSQVTVSIDDLPTVEEIEDKPEDLMFGRVRVIGFDEPTQRDIWNYAPLGFLTSAEYFKARKFSMGNVRSLSQSARHLVIEAGREDELMQAVPVKPGQAPEAVNNSVAFPIAILDEALEASLPSVAPLAGKING